MNRFSSEAAGARVRAVSNARASSPHAGGDARSARALFRRAYRVARLERAYGPMGTLGLLRVLSLPLGWAAALCAFEGSSRLMVLLATLHPVLLFWIAFGLGVVSAIWFQFVFLRLFSLVRGRTKGREAARSAGLVSLLIK